MVDATIMVYGLGFILTMLIVVVAALVLWIRELFWKIKWRIHVVKFLARG